MGDISAPSHQVEAKDEIHVLVTGFGPWSSNTTNPSFLIASSLPSLLHLPGLKSHIHTTPDPIPVAYTSVRSQIPPLLFPAVTTSPPPIFDLILFIGMAGGLSSYTYKLEHLARRDGYSEPDGTGARLSDSAAKLWEQGYGAPEVLRPGLDMGDVMGRWRQGVDGLEDGEGCKGVEVRRSEDAGRFLCEFIYFTGLVEYWRRGRGACCAFMHVPGNVDEASVRRGARVAEELIRALVGSGRESGLIG